MTESVGRIEYYSITGTERDVIGERRSLDRENLPPLCLKKAVGRFPLIEKELKKRSGVEIPKDMAVVDFLAISAAAVAQVAREELGLDEKAPSSVQLTVDDSPEYKSHFGNTLGEVSMLPFEINYLDEESSIDGSVNMPGYYDKGLPFSCTGRKGGETVRIAPMGEENAYNYLYDVQNGEFSPLGERFLDNIGSMLGQSGGKDSSGMLLLFSEE